MTEINLATKLRQEILQTPWCNLQREFAAGRLIAVNNRLDLAEVGCRMALDDKTTFSAWLNEGLVFKPGSDQAGDWHRNSSQFEMLIVSPFVLIKELTE